MGGTAVKNHPSGAPEFYMVKPLCGEPVSLGIAAHEATKADHLSVFSILAGRHRERRLSPSCSKPKKCCHGRS